MSVTFWEVTRRVELRQAVRRGRQSGSDLVREGAARIASTSEPLDNTAGFLGGRSRGILLVLGILVVCRLCFHALFLPAYEGPDEPLHLGRISSFADHPFGVAFTGESLDGSIIRAVESRPCAQTIRQTRPCPPFGTSPGTFNLLRPLPRQPDPRRGRNPENNQPPLFYLTVGLAIRAASRSGWQGWLDAPDVRLLLVRLTCVGLVALAVFLPLRGVVLGRSRSLAVAGLLLLFLPGASESLARCANDAPVFCWAAFLIYALRRNASLAWILLLLALGPLIKLTALPVAMFAVVALWFQRGWKSALLASVSSVLVFLVQLLRGWKYGGTYELNRPIPGIQEPFPHLIFGLARSFYTFLKTIFWLGGWSFFRAPSVLVVAYFLLLLSVVVLAKFRPLTTAHWPHLAGAAVAFGGLLTFILANRRFFGDWGGVGGWYAWGWAPWLLIAADDLALFPKRVGGMLLATTAGFVVAANIAWFAKAIRLYA